MDDHLERIAWPVPTARLTLRRATAADLDEIWRYRRLESVTRWLSTAPTTLTAHRDTFLARGLGALLVAELDDVVVGDLMLRVEDAWAQTEVAERARCAQAELGWCFDPAYAGRGLATEALRALLGLGFADLGLHRVYAACFAANEPSWRLMERVGMRLEMRAVRDSLHRSGDWMDGLQYALLADEWTG